VDTVVPRTTRRRQPCFGIHAGTVAEGDVGAAIRREYPAIGHAVHVAARARRAADQGARTPDPGAHRDRHEIGGTLALVDVGDVAAKGVPEPMRFFAPGANGDQESIADGVVAIPTTS